MASQLLTGVAAQVLVHAMLEEVIVIEIPIVLEVLPVVQITAWMTLHQQEVIGSQALTVVSVIF